MKSRLLLLASLGLLWGLSSLALSARAPDSIVVDFADNYETSALTESTTLTGYLVAVADRVALQYADLLAHVDLVPAPAALNDRLNAVADRIRLTYGDRARHVALTAVPPTLQTHLAAVPDRVVFQYPDLNRRVGLGYPAALIGDTTPPQITAPPTAQVSGTTAVLHWTTDEFTTFVLHYGPSPGTYTSQVSSTQFNTQHQATLTNLTADVYYYQIVSTDLSGNQAASPEFILPLERLIFLPFLTR